MEPEEIPQWQKNLGISLGILLLGAVLTIALTPGGGFLLAPYVLLAGVGIFGLLALMIAVSRALRRPVSYFQIGGTPAHAALRVWLWAVVIGYFACGRIPWYTRMVPPKLRLDGGSDLLFAALMGLPVAAVIYLLSRWWASSRK